MTLRLAYTWLNTLVLFKFIHAICFWWNAECLGCGMMRMWDIRDDGCSEWGMLDVCDIADMEYLRSGMFGMQNVYDVECLELGCLWFEIFRMYDVRDVVCGMWNACWDVECWFTKWLESKMDRFNLKSRFGIKFLTLPVMLLI